MNATASLLAACVFVNLAACTRPLDVAAPQNITLKSALIDVADSLAAARAHQIPGGKIGLGVEEATVVFNISATSVDETTLKIEVAAGESVGFPLSGLFQDKLTNTGTRGNQITIKFKPVSGGKTAGTVLGGKVILSVPPKKLSE